MASLSAEEVPTGTTTDAKYKIREIIQETAPISVKVLEILKLTNSYKYIRDYIDSVMNEVDSKQLDSLDQSGPYARTTAERMRATTSCKRWQVKLFLLFDYLEKEGSDTSIVTLFPFILDGIQGTSFLDHTALDYIGSRFLSIYNIDPNDPSVPLFPKIVAMNKIPKPPLVDISKSIIQEILDNSSKNVNLHSMCIYANIPDSPVYNIWHYFTFIVHTISPTQKHVYISSSYGSEFVKCPQYVTDLGVCTNTKSGWKLSNELDRFLDFCIYATTLSLDREQRVSKNVDMVKELYKEYFLKYCDDVLADDENEPDESKWGELIADGEKMEMDTVFSGVSDGGEGRITIGVGYIGGYNELLNQYLAAIASVPDAGGGAAAMDMSGGRKTTRRRRSKGGRGRTKRPRQRTTAKRKTTKKRKSNVTPHVKNAARKKGGSSLGFTTKEGFGFGKFHNVFQKEEEGQDALGSKQKCWKIMGHNITCKRENNGKDGASGTPTKGSDKPLSPTPSEAAVPTKKKPWYQVWGGRKTMKKRKSNVTPHVKNAARKIIIPINWDSPDAGYKDLKNRKVLDFLTSNINHGYNLIQTQPEKYFKAYGKNKLHLQAIRVTEWPTPASWNKSDATKMNPLLSCTSYNDWIKIPPCTRNPQRAKIFAKLKSNSFVGGFGTYLWRIFSGEIDVGKHKEFVKALKKTFHKKPILIHNTDVDWFHAKEVV